MHRASIKYYFAPLAPPDNIGGLYAVTASGDAGRAPQGRPAQNDNNL
jgi:hypothetical protein